MKLIKTLSILLVIVVVFGSAMFALNLYTGPIIEANNAGAANDRLNAVMPDGRGYENILDTLTGVPATVTEVYRETSGLGYVLVANGMTDYSSTPMVVIVGVSADGKICGIKIDSYGDDSGSNWTPKLDAAGYPETFIGQDSSLADVSIVAKATNSSNGFKNAVSDAMSVLIANDMIAAGVKSDMQILTELLATVAPSFGSAKELPVSGNIQLALQPKSGTGTGFAYVIAEGDASYLAVVNAMGVCKVYDVAGADVTAAHTAIVSEAKAHAAAAQTDYQGVLENKVAGLMSDVTNTNALALDSFSTVVSAMTFTVGDATYYGFCSRVAAYNNMPMEIFVVLDENGAIVKLDATEFILGKDHFTGFGGMDDDAYREGFTGVTSDTFTGDEAFIATATVSTNAMKKAVSDTFAAFDLVKGGDA